MAQALGSPAEFGILALQKRTNKKNSQFLVRGPHFFGFCFTCLPPEVKYGGGGEGGTFVSLAKTPGQLGPRKVKKTSLLTCWKPCGFYSYTLKKLDLLETAFEKSVSNSGHTDLFVNCIGTSHSQPAFVHDDENKSIFVPLCVKFLRLRQIITQTYTTSAISSNIKSKSTTIHYLASNLSLTDISCFQIFHLLYKSTISLIIVQYVKKELTLHTHSF